jgi:predicted HD superfamily hydrolase involved in NAD metabolism
MKSKLKKDFLYREILDFLKQSLPPKRLQHVLGMANLSQRLATHHGLDPQRATLAALLHDIARCWAPQDLVRYVRQHHLKIPHRDFLCRVEPLLLHSFVGVHWTKKMFPKVDPEILSAIEKHSFAAPSMTLFEKLIYVADLAAPDRKFPEVKRLRFLAFKNLNQAFIEAMRIKMVHLLKTNQSLYPDAATIWNQFIPRTAIGSREQRRGKVKGKGVVRSSVVQKAW